MNTLSYSYFITFIFRFATQRSYPEGSEEFRGPVCQKYKSFTGEDRCGDKPFANGYLAPPYSDERVDGSVLVPNFPPSILVQESYDSREIEQRLATKALQFIRDNANQEVNNLKKILKKFGFFKYLILSYSLIFFSISYFWIFL